MMPFPSGNLILCTKNTISLIVQSVQKSLFLLNYTTANSGSGVPLWLHATTNYQSSIING